MVFIITSSKKKYKRVIFLFLKIFFKKMKILLIVYVRTKKSSNKKYCTKHVHKYSIYGLSEQSFFNCFCKSFNFKLALCKYYA